MTTVISLLHVLERRTFLCLFCGFNPATFMLVLSHEDLTPTGRQEFDSFVFLNFRTILKEFLIALSKTFIDKDSILLGKA